ncbi:lysophospholipid acyltransferase family protein [Evansella clarkii]|uniref:lysophospholipid acyltransferase family protein n=1 Tax=Evansella clarkii TaxID=79879 RepID=UPI000B431058|nr:lysophospholipid acyltransferase family protein [Evansella clarkii]
MLRTIFWFIYFFSYLVWAMPSLWKADRLKKQGKTEEHERHVEKITSDWAAALLKVAGVKVHVHGKENLPDQENCLIVSNHQGNFDIPVLLANLERKIGFISKVEVKKIPIIPGWMKHMHCIFMDRKNRRQSIKAILDGARNLEEGHNIVIFPEGTRSKGGPVGMFKKGSFKLASKSGAAILPIAINGSYKAMESNKNIIRPAEVHLTILPPVRIHQKYPGMELEQLADIVKGQIEEALAGTQKKAGKI